MIAACILVDRHFIVTKTTQDCLGMKFIFLPYVMCMTRLFFMTVITRIIFSTTFEFYRDDVQRRVIMHTAGVRIKQFTFDVWSAIIAHCFLVTHAVFFETFCPTSVAISFGERLPSIIKTSPCRRWRRDRTHPPRWPSSRVAGWPQIQPSVVEAMQHRGRRLASDIIITWSLCTHQDSCGASSGSSTRRRQARNRAIA
jgi:hypothetical protein